MGGRWELMNHCRMCREWGQMGGRPQRESGQAMVQKVRLMRDSGWRPWGVGGRGAIPEAGISQEASLQLWGDVGELSFASPRAPGLGW